LSGVDLRLGKTVRFVRFCLHVREHSDWRQTSLPAVSLRRGRSRGLRTRSQSPSTSRSPRAHFLTEAAAFLEGAVADSVLTFWQGLSSARSPSRSAAVRVRWR
jgi:hypothetical protein